MFAEPCAFDVARTPNEHVGFGCRGPHQCLGARPGMRETLEITGPPEMLLSNFIDRIKRMPCAWTKRAS